jgi:predicted amidohydrolase
VAHGPTLTVAVAQPALASMDVEGNVSAHAEAVRSAEARVAVFPELSLTGYEQDAPAIATSDPRLGPLVDACADTRSTALVGAPVADEEGHQFIAMLAVDAAGAAVVYRKVWLGSEEARRFTPGPAPAVLEIDGWRLGLAICRDTGIAAHAAETAALGIDAYVAGTVKHATEATLQHERGRRIADEHRVWVAIASFAGPTGGGFDATAGRSAIWAPGGAAVCMLDDRPTRIGRAALVRA